MTHLRAFHDHDGDPGAYLDARASILTGVAEGITDAPGTGLSARLDAFWAGWSATADEPDALEARSTLLARANAVAEALNSATAALARLAGDVQEQLRRSVIRVNDSVGWLDSTLALDADLRPTDGSAWAQSEALAATIPGYQACLDRIAHTLARTVNALHTGGYDRSGTPGMPFFSGVTAATISVIPARPGRIAASATCFPDATIARQLAEIGRSADDPGSAYRALVATVAAERDDAMARAAERRSRAMAARRAPRSARADAGRLLSDQCIFRAGRHLLGSLDEALAALGSTFDGPIARETVLDAVVQMSAADVAYSAARQTIQRVHQVSIDEFVG